MMMQADRMLTDEESSTSTLLEDRSSPALLEEDAHRAGRLRAMHNLERSVHLLNESLHSPSGSHARPSSVLRSRSKAGLAVSSSASANFDFSPIASPSRRFYTSDLSIVDTNASFASGMTLPTVESVDGLSQSETDSILLPYTETTSDVNSSVLLEFLRAKQELSTVAQAFELIERYSLICSEASSRILAAHLKSNAPGQSTSVSEFKEWLKEEANTWKLIKVLYQDRLEGGDEGMMVDTMGKYQSAADVTQQFYEQNGAVRQAQLVVDWLEKCAWNKLIENESKLEFFADSSGPWESTRCALEQQQLHYSRPQERTCVSKLDPDAPLRQRAQLSTLDEDELQMLGLGVLSRVRAGDLAGAQALCQRLGQAWLAAALEGWRLYHDPNYDMEGAGETLQGALGNPNRDLYKLVCWRLAEDKRLAPTLRAVYGVYSGHLMQVLPVLKTWQDYLWAHLKTHVDQQVEQELRLTLNLTRSWINLPEDYQMLSLSKIFMEVEAYCKKQKAKVPGVLNNVQKNVILNMEPKLVDELSDTKQINQKQYQQHLQRFGAHAVLILKALSIQLPADKCERVLQNYVENLMSEGDTRLVAAYMGTLLKSSQLQLYTNYCVEITDYERRMECVSLGQAEGLPMESITRQVVDKLIAKHCVVMEQEGGLDVANLMGGNLTKEDETLVGAVEWLLFNPMQCCQALRQANTIARMFLGAHKLAGCKAVLNKLPETILEDVHLFWSKQPGETDELPPDEQNAVREYLCHMMYLDAQEHFSLWFQHFHLSKPKMPHPPAGRDFSERVAFEHQEQQYEAEVRRWKAALENFSATTKQTLYNVLLFPEGSGWMVDQAEPQELNGQRQQQLRVIRRLCVPVLVSVLHNVLHGTESYAECLALADMLASEDRCLYKYFNQDELQKLMYKLRESSLALLSKNTTDPLGYASA